MGKNAEPTVERDDEAEITRLVYLDKVVDEGDGSLGTDCVYLWVDTDPDSNDRGVWHVRAEVAERRGEHSVEELEAIRDALSSMINTLKVLRCDPAPVEVMTLDQFARVVEGEHEVPC